MTSLLAFAQADVSSGEEPAGAFIMLVIIVGFLWAIRSACSRKKEYDVHMVGKIRQRR